MLPRISPLLFVAAGLLMAVPYTLPAIGRALSQRPLFAAGYLGLLLGILGVYVVLGIRGQQSRAQQSSEDAHNN